MNKEKHLMDFIIKLEVENERLKSQLDITTRALDNTVNIVDKLVQNSPETGLKIELKPLIQENSKLKIENHEQKELFTKELLGRLATQGKVLFKCGRCGAEMLLNTKTSDGRICPCCHYTKVHPYR